MNKLFKFILPTSTIVLGFTSLLTSCDNKKDHYDLNWQYIYSDGRWTPFIPSTSELPHDTKTNDEATKMYAEVIAKKNIIMTDDFFHTGNINFEKYNKPQYKGTYITQAISFVDSALEETKYTPNPMVLLSFKFQIHTHIVINEQPASDIIDTAVFKKYPYCISYNETKSSWNLLAFGWSDPLSPTIDDRLKLDTKWKFSFKSCIQGGIQPKPNIDEGSYDYTIAEASDDDKKTFKQDLKTFGLYESYYLSELTYKPEC